MSEITRYTPDLTGIGMRQSHAGTYVLYSDNAAREAALQQQLSDQRAVIERLEGMYRAERDKGAAAS